jgi:hypothetical protein
MWVLLSTSHIRRYAKLFFSILNARFVPKACIARADINGCYLEAAIRI